MAIQARIAVLLSVFFAGCATRGSNNESSTNINEFSLDYLVGNPLRKEDDWQPTFTSILADVGILQLGESIHLTHELPLARLPLLQVATEHSHFDVLAFEGSPVDFWIGVDEAFAQDKPSARNLQRLAIGGLWQTEEMRQVFKFFLVSLRSAKPFYITSFDSQPGMSFYFVRHPDELFPRLLSRLRRYSSADQNREDDEIAKGLMPLQGCLSKSFPSSKIELAKIKGQINALRSRILSVLPMVREQHPRSPHAAALALLPDSLEMTFELCSSHRDRVHLDDERRTYQETRDRLNSNQAMRIQNQVSQSHRVVLWAHHSHVNYNSNGTNRVSMGQLLKKWLGHRIFTVGSFAVGGQALGVIDDSELRPINLDQHSKSLETKLSALWPGPYFVAFNDDGQAELPPSIKLPLEARHEATSSWTINLNRDFDAMIVIPTVSLPKIDMAHP